jgi:predicted transcriptional regulator
MKRDRLEIIGAILAICKNGAKKTEIVYKANLNFKNAEGYLQWLADRELITKEGKLFKTSSKGVKLLSDLQGASAILDLNNNSVA